MHEGVGSKRTSGISGQVEECRCKGKRTGLRCRVICFYLRFVCHVSREFLQGWQPEKEAAEESICTEPQGIAAPDVRRLMGDDRI